MVVVAMTMQIYQGLGCPDLVAAKLLDYTTVGNRCWVAMLSCELLWLDVTTTTLWQQAVVLGCGVGVGVGPGVGAVADGGSNSNRGSNIIGSGGVGVVVLVLGGGAGGGGCGDRDYDDADNGE